jgi:hypothetical protein
MQKHKSKLDLLGNVLKINQLAPSISIETGE